MLCPISCAHISVMCPFTDVHTLFPLSIAKPGYSWDILYCSLLALNIMVISWLVDLFLPYFLSLFVGC